MNDCRQQFLAHFGVPAPTPKAIYKMVKKMEDYHTCHNVNSGHSGPPTTVKTFDNVIKVVESVANLPKLGTRPRAALLDINRRTLQQILNSDLAYHPYHIKRLHAMLPRDHAARVQFATWFIGMHNADEDFVDNIWYTDESHIHLDGYTNSQNCIHWGSSRPEEFTRKSLHPTKVTVWCAISSHGILGPYLFQDANGARVNVRGSNYLDMLQTQFYPDLQDLVMSRGLDFTKMWLMQDGARPHIYTPARAYLNNIFSGRVIGERFTNPWPARSPDLTPCDFFLWGWLKDQVYKQLPIPDARTLENVTKQILGALPAAYCQRACRSIVKRLTKVCEVNGENIEHML